jgi:hypothetical protein
LFIILNVFTGMKQQRKKLLEKIKEED